MTEVWTFQMTGKKINRRATDNLKSNMTRRRSKTARSRRPESLSEEDWVAAALDLLAEHNIGAVEIHGLCRRLGVTKGSFYWHFQSRRDLLAVILDDWQRRMTVDVADRASRHSVSPTAVLGYLLGLIRKPRPNRNAAIERSVRDWARVDPIAHAAVVEVDQARLAFFEQLFRESDFPENEARIRAYAAYAIMMGDSILKETTNTSCEPKDYVDTCVELLFGQRGQHVRYLRALGGGR
jgi:AcrR family transcriptional regulator